MEPYEISRLLNDSNLSKFVTNKQMEVNDYQVVNIPLTEI